MGNFETGYVFFELLQNRGHIFEAIYTKDLPWTMDLNSKLQRDAILTSREGLPELLQFYKYTQEKDCAFAARSFSKITIVIIRWMSPYPPPELQNEERQLSQRWDNPFPRCHQPCRRWPE